MSQKSSALVSVLQSMVGRVIFTIINAATGMLTARALHPAGRGELSALGVWPNFLGGLMTFGLPSALVFWTRKDPSSERDLIWASLPLTLAFSLVAVAVGIIGIPFWLSQYDPHVIVVAQVFMLNAFVVLLTTNARAICEAQGDFLASSVALCMTPMLTIIGLVALDVTHRLTPITAAGTYIVSGVPACVFLGYRLRSRFTALPRKLYESSMQLLSYGVRSYGVDICGTLSLYADQALVVHALNPEAMGTYVVALSLSRTLGVIHQTVATVLFPKAVAREVPDLIALTGRAVRISTTLTLLTGVLVGACGPYLLALLYGKEYRSATTILNILIAEAVLTGMALVLTRAYMAVGRPGVVTLLQSSGLVLSLPLLAVFIPKYGVLGASVALLLASIVRLVFSMWSFKWVLHVRPPSIIPRLDELNELTRMILTKARARSQRRIAIKEVA